MQLPENRFLACAVLFAPPLSLTALLLSLRWGLFFMALGMLSFWFTVQVIWAFLFRDVDNAIPMEDDGRGLFV